MLFECEDDVKKARACANPLLRGAEGCVMRADRTLAKHTPAIARAVAPPLKRGF